MGSPSQLAHGVRQHAFSSPSGSQRNSFYQNNSWPFLVQPVGAYCATKLHKGTRCTLLNCFRKKYWKSHSQHWSKEAASRSGLWLRSHSSSEPCLKMIDRAIDSVHVEVCQPTCKENLQNLEFPAKLHGVAEELKTWQVPRCQPRQEPTGVTDPKGPTMSNL